MFWASEIFWAIGMFTAPLTRYLISDDLQSAPSSYSAEVVVGHIQCVSLSLGAIQKGRPGVGGGGRKVITRRHDEFIWPSYSPDLNPCDFFLWGYLKTRVYADPTPSTLDELKTKIKSEILAINRDKDLFDRVYENFLTRLQYVLSTKGNHIENILK